MRFAYFYGMKRKHEIKKTATRLLELLGYYDSQPDYLFKVAKPKFTLKALTTENKHLKSLTLKNTGKVYDSLVRT